MSPIVRATLLLSLVSVAAQAGGSVEGTITVKADGKPGTVKNAFVFIKGFPTPPPKEPVVMSQSGREFSPVVLPVIKQGKVRFTNEELVEIYHHVFTPKSGKLDLNSKKYKPPEFFISEKLIYDGPFNIFCDIHKEMIATIFVVPNKHHLVLSAAEGDSSKFKLDGLPAGEWTIVGWHRSAAKQVELPVVVKDAQTTRIELVLDGETALEKALKEHKRKAGQYATKADGGAVGELGESW